MGEAWYQFILSGYFRDYVIDLAAYNTNFWVSLDDDEINRVMNTKYSFTRHEIIWGFFWYLESGWCLRYLACHLPPPFDYRHFLYALKSPFLTCWKPFRQPLREARLEPSGRRSRAQPISSCETALPILCSVVKYAKNHHFKSSKKQKLEEQDKNFILG
jgi:hypothetical protein